jgi:hypothetical protein
MSVVSMRLMLASCVAAPARAGFDQATLAFYFFSVVTWRLFIFFSSNLAVFYFFQ